MKKEIIKIKGITCSACATKELYFKTAGVIITLILLGKYPGSGIQR
ncbi:hypothetical protein [Acetobacterium sp.]